MLERITRLAERWIDVILGREPAQRVRLGMCVTALVYYLLYCGLLGLQVLLGFADPMPTVALVVCALATAIGFYALIRSGANLRFERDPSLTIPQLGAGVVLTMWHYALIGPSAPTVLIILASQIVYGVFSLSPVQVSRLTIATLVSLGATMVACNHIDAARYPADLQLMVFLYSCVVFPLLASMARRVASMNEKLRTQRSELREALQRLQDLATRDELTRTYNRRHMNDLLAEQHQLHARSGEPMSLALLDIDLFKGINDRFGHKAGDLVLQQFACSTREVLRASDQLCRWGGEEFMVLFPNTSPDTAQRVLDRLQAHLATVDFSAAAPGLRISFSAGITLVKPYDDMDRAAERADLAMYQAKSRGRRCTVLA